MQVQHEPPLLRLLVIRAVKLPELLHAAALPHLDAAGGAVRFRRRSERELKADAEPQHARCAAHAQQRLRHGQISSRIALVSRCGATRTHGA